MSTLGSDEAVGLVELRREVRRFLAEQRETGGFTPGVDTWLTRFDPAFSRLLAERGWIGMTIPEKYGGHGRSFLERFVVTEELVAAGAPVGYHWVADRQIAPTLLSVGTEEQKHAYLPRIARGELCFAIGMSEPTSGSDLASVRTKGVRTDGGWLISGTKSWTSGGHLADAFFALARTEPLEVNHRHAGLSQFIVDLRAPGVHISPVISMSGSHHFNEVTLDEVFVPDSRVLGELGQGWQQVTSELAYERSGPERFLSAQVLLNGLLDTRSATPADPELGRLAARVVGLHLMSSQIAERLQTGERPDLAAAMVKHLGTLTEGDIVDHADARLPAADPLRALADIGVLQRPGFTIRGGTNEVLRGVIARGLGLR